MGVEMARARPTMALPKYTQRKRRNKILFLGLLLLLILLISVLFVRFFYLKEAPLPMVEEVAKGTITPPSFLFAITGGPGDLALSQPLGVAIHPSTTNVYVTSYIRGKYGRGRVEVFDPRGNYLFSFNQTEKEDTLRAPMYVAINPRSGNVYVSDKLTKSVYIFSRDGKFISTFVPNNDPNLVWAPVAMAFDQDDNFYVSSVYPQHEIFVFNGSGKLILKFGETGTTQKKGLALGKFAFPNGIVVDKDSKIFIADSNNNRIQVFNRKGKFVYAIDTGGLPRGIAIDRKNRLYVVDALGHDISIYDKKSKGGSALATFGGQGIEYGQFLFPNGLALDANGRIYITDRENNRVQVWGWPAVAVVPAPVRRAIPVIVFLLPFIMYALWRAIRRRRHLASQDFISKVIEKNQLNKTKDKLKKVFVSQDTYEALKGYKEYDLEIERVIKPIKVDEEQVKNFQKTHEVSEETATLFVRAQRGLVKPRMFSEGAEVHTTAQKLNVESMDHALFMEYYHVK